MDGGADERISVRATNVPHLPNDVSPWAAVLTEAGVTALNGLRRTGTLNSRALIVGPGTLGGIATQRLTARGVQVDVLERNEQRAVLVQEWGAEPCVTPVDSAYDVVVEAGGTAEAVRSAWGAGGLGVAVALLAVQGHDVDGVDIDPIVLTDTSVFGVLKGPGVYGAMLDEIGPGHVRAEDLVDWGSKLQSAPAEFGWLASNERAKPKVLIRIGASEESKGHQ
jgi:threonine dehydrogenase-like Zn-dependent dehydrogenase